MLRQALLPLLLAAVAVRGAANLPPLQSKLSNVIKDVEGLASDRARVEDNIKTLKKSGLDRLQGALTNPVMQPFDKDSDAALSLAGASVKELSQVAQDALGGGALGGDITCFWNDDGIVTGLQQGNLTICSTASNSVVVKLLDGFVSGLKVAPAKSGAGIGRLDFYVSTPGNVIPTVFPCGAAPSGKSVSALQANHALVSIAGNCNGTAAAGRRRSLLDTMLDRSGRNLAQAGVGGLSLTLVTAVVDESKPMGGGMQVVDRMGVICDGITTYESTPATSTSLRVCSLISPACDGITTYETTAPTQFADRVCTMMSPPCDGVTNFARIVGNSTNNRVCYPLSPCDGVITFESTPPTPYADRICSLTAPECDGVTTYELYAPSPLRDRVCVNVTAACDGVATYESAAPTPQQNRVCSVVSPPCNGVTLFETSGSTQFTDRVCSEMTPPCDGVTNFARIPGNSTTDRVCYPLSPSCDGEITFESTPPSPYADRVCSALSAACDGVTTYQRYGPTPLRDRVCANVTAACDGVSTYESVASTPVRDRLCSPISPACDGVKRFEAAAPTPLKDRVCSIVTPLCDGFEYYETAPPTPTSDRVCSSISAPCDGVTTYQTTPPGARQNRVCTAVSPACDGVTTFESIGASFTSDRVCSPVTVCDTLLTYEKSGSTPLLDRVCVPFTQCALGITYETVAPLRNGPSSTDRVCKPVTQCVDFQVATTPATLTSNAVCGAANFGTHCDYGNIPNTDDCGHAKVCLNQQTAADLYLRYANCTDGNFAGQFPSSVAQPTIIAFAQTGVYPAGGVSCTVEVRKKTDDGLVEFLSVQQSNCDVAAPPSSNYYRGGDMNVCAGQQTCSSGSPTNTAFSHTNPDAPNFNGNYIASNLIYHVRTSASSFFYNLFGTNFVTSENVAGNVEIFGPATCPAGKALKIEKVEPVGDPYDSSTENDGTVKLSGSSVNCREVAQKITTGANIKDAVTVSQSYANANSYKDALEASLEVKFGIPIFEEVKLGVKRTREFTTTSTKTESTSSSQEITLAFTLDDVVPPLSNCSLAGTYQTSIVRWKQKVMVTFFSNCNQGLKTVPDVVSFKATGVVLANSKYDVDFLQCTPPNLSLCQAPTYGSPVPSQTCISNVQCAAAGFATNKDALCCPTADKRYLDCCAQAIAHPECGPTTYRSLTDAICPSMTNKYSSCCGSKQTD